MKEDTKKILKQWKENFLIISNELDDARKMIKEWEDRSEKVHKTSRKYF